MLLGHHARLGLRTSAFRAARLTTRNSSNLADKYHSKVSVLPFTNDVASTQTKLNLLVPPMFGLVPTLLGYAQMLFGPEVIDSGIKRTEFKPVYIPTWVVDSVVSFTSQIADGDRNTALHFFEGVLPGLHYHPLSRWLARFDTADVAKPFSKDHLEPLEGKHEILTLPYTTSPLAIPRALSECPYDDIEVSEGWNVDPKSIEFKLLAAYPVLQPVYLSEFVMGNQNLTVIAHGHYDYFAVWGHVNHPDTWINNLTTGVVVTYLRTLATELSGGPPAITELITESCTPENLERIAEEVNMNDPRIQPISSAKATRHWMDLVGKADGMKFIIDNIPPNTTVINAVTGDRLVGGEEGDARAPLRRQLRDVEAEIEASKPAWIAEWDGLKADTSEEKSPSE